MSEKFVPANELKEISYLRRAESGDVFVCTNSALYWKRALGVTKAKRRVSSLATFCPHRFVYRAVYLESNKNLPTYV